MRSTTAVDMIPAETIKAVSERLRENKPVRRRLATSGRLHIDRQLPFLCVYRRPADRLDAGTAKLVTGLASYLVISGDRPLRSSVSQVARTVASALTPAFGAFLLLEVWSQDVAAAGPRFRLQVPRDAGLDSFVEFFQNELAQIDLKEGPLPVRVVRGARSAPKGMAPILSASRVASLGCTLLGLEVPALYRDSASGREYPELLRDLRRRLKHALERVFHRFSCTQTSSCPVDYHMMGRRAVVKAVWEVDKKLSGVGDQFDFLLQVTPVNTSEAWEVFRKSGFERPPKLRYRPLPADPVLLKRRLWAIPVERVEDPTLYDLFRQKQDELDREITLLLDIETRSFVHGAAQIFGEVEEDLLDLAHRVLQRCPVSAGDDTSTGRVGAQAFARRAQREIQYYRKQWSGVDARVEVRSDVTRGLMVSKGSLLIGEGTWIPTPRVEALLQHEVGTHIVTFYNGKAQRLRQLYSGLAGYDPLQEGIAVLAEHLVGGLTLGRLRLLAARVVAVHGMLQGASFVETFRGLTKTHGFEPRTAFTVTMRIYRGGGLTKDAAYLRGLAELLDYLGKGGQIEPLLVGKIATDHLSIIRELRLRGILRAPPLRPRYLEESGARERLDRVRRGLTVLDLAP